MAIPVVASPLASGARQLARPSLEPVALARPSVALSSHPAGRPTAVPSPPEALTKARPAWKRRLDRLTRGVNMGVAVHEGGTTLYTRRDRRRRRPASNQKLLLSMALLSRWGRNDRISTRAVARGVDHGVVLGNLWVLGRGDPTIAAGRRYARGLGVRPTYVGRIARRLEVAGITRIRGRVMGSPGYFTHDWSAPGWRPYYRRLYIALPSALTLNGNSARGRFITDPERRLARALTRRLEKIGIGVGGRPGSGRPPGGLDEVARVRSAPLSKLLGYMNRTSSNFFAEVLGKRLGADHLGPAGTIAKGARVLRRWASKRGIAIASHDSSGLSHANRISVRGLVRLLEAGAAAPWAGALRRSLATPGRGTLKDRLRGVRVRAKTGTLIGVSALSGWVWLERRQTWAEFSIMSSGLPKARATRIEDAIVRVVARRAS